MDTIFKSFDPKSNKKFSVHVSFGFLNNFLPKHEKLCRSRFIDRNESLLSKRSESRARAESHEVVICKLLCKTVLTGHSKDKVEEEDRCI